MSKIVIHLVNNAVASITGPGYVHVRTTQEYLPTPPPDAFGNCFSGDTVVVTISDNGQAIPIEDVNKLFEPFFMRKTVGRSGTGLELAIVRQCALDMGGAVAVKSTVGVGTTFKLFFPVARVFTIRPAAPTINAS
jgi:signal transduction histidine kinase